MIAILWFLRMWLIGGTICAMAFSLILILMRKFDDAFLRQKMLKGETDPERIAVAEVFGSKIGVIVLIMILWPVLVWATVKSLFGGTRG